MDTSFRSLLIELGISSDDSIVDYYPRVRDTDQVTVLKCKKSGVYFLSDNAFGAEERYKKVDEFEYWERDWNKHKANDGDEPKIFEDDRRRAKQFQSYIEDSSWLDFGCGGGGALRLAHQSSKKAIGLEIQPGPRAYLNQVGIECVESLGDVDDESLDVVTLFHVFEHLQNPIEVLGEIAQKLVSGGTIIIEVPQANDALLSLYDSNSFKEFTFWSEHLILHTRSSLAKFIEQCDSLELESIQGFQRYPLANHLYWLAKEMPGGHEKWAFLNNDPLQEAYAETLQSLDMTDTLIAYIQKK